MRIAIVDVDKCLVSNGTSDYNEALIAYLRDGGFDEVVLMTGRTLGDIRTHVLGGKEGDSDLKWKRQLITNVKKTLEEALGKDVIVSLPHDHALEEVVENIGVGDGFVRYMAPRDALFDQCTTRDGALAIGGGDLTFQDPLTGDMVTVDEYVVSKLVQGGDTEKKGQSQKLLRHLIQKKPHHDNVLHVEYFDDKAENLVSVKGALEDLVRTKYPGVEIKVYTANVDIDLAVVGGGRRDNTVEQLGLLSEQKERDVAAAAADADAAAARRQPKAPAAKPIPPEKTQLAQEIVANLRELGITKWISDFDGTLLRTHTVHNNQIRDLFTTGYSRDGRLKPQQGRPSTDTLFADLDLLKAILIECNRQGIEFHIASKQYSQVVKAIVAESIGNDADGKPLIPGDRILGADNGGGHKHAAVRKICKSGEDGEEQGLYMDDMRKEFEGISYDEDSEEVPQENIMCFGGGVELPEYSGVRCAAKENNAASDGFVGYGFNADRAQKLNAQLAEKVAQRKAQASAGKGKGSAAAAAAAPSATPTVTTTAATTATATTAPAVTTTAPASVAPIFTKPSEIAPINQEPIDKTTYAQSANEGKISVAENIGRRSTQQDAIIIAQYKSAATPAEFLSKTLEDLTDRCFNYQNGTTICSSIVEKKADGGVVITTAHKGDSRASLVVSYKDASGVVIYKSIALTEDHKPSLPRVKKRLADGEHMVWGGRIDGNLATGSALGDKECFIDGSTDSGNVAITDVLEFDLNQILQDIGIDPASLLDVDLVVGCDGLFDGAYKDDFEYSLDENGVRSCKSNDGENINLSSYKKAWKGNEEGLSFAQYCMKRALEETRDNVSVAAVRVMDATQVVLPEASIMLVVADGHGDTQRLADDKREGAVANFAANTVELDEKIDGLDVAALATAYMCQQAGCTLEDTVNPYASDPNHPFVTYLAELGKVRNFIPTQQNQVELSFVDALLNIKFPSVKLLELFKKEFGEAIDVRDSSAVVKADYFSDAAKKKLLCEYLGVDGSKVMQSMVPLKVKARSGYDLMVIELLKKSIKSFGGDEGDLSAILQAKNSSDIVRFFVNHPDKTKYLARSLCGGKNVLLDNILSNIINEGNDIKNSDTKNALIQKVIKNTIKYGDDKLLKDLLKRTGLRYIEDNMLHAVGQAVLEVTTSKNSAEIQHVLSQIQLITSLDAAVLEKYKSDLNKVLKAPAATASATTATAPAAVTATATAATTVAAATTSAAATATATATAAAVLAPTAAAAKSKVVSRADIQEALRQEQVTLNAIQQKINAFKAEYSKPKLKKVGDGSDKLYSPNEAFGDKISQGKPHDMKVAAAEYAVLGVLKKAKEMGEGLKVVNQAQYDADKEWSRIRGTKESRFDQFADFAKRAFEGVDFSKIVTPNFRNCVFDGECKFPKGVAWIKEAHFSECKIDLKALNDNQKDVFRAVFGKATAKLEDGFLVIKKREIAKEREIAKAPGSSPKQPISQFRLAPERVNAVV